MAMTLRFRSTFDGRIDAKGRVSIPAKYRQDLKATGDERLVLTRDLVRDCVVVYPMDAWERFEQRVVDKPQSDPTVQHIRNHAIAYATEVVSDAYGRVILKEGLRSYAGIELDSDIKVIGQVDRFEIWNAERWSKQEETSAQSRAHWVAGLRELGF